MGASEPQMSRRAVFKFRLYIAGDAQNSVEALANLTTICRKHLPGLYNIEVMDVFLEPARALTDGIFMTPTLVKLAPAPTRTIIGNLSQTGVVLQALGLEASVA
jgi:circadian clock protein KaiB